MTVLIGSSYRLFGESEAFTNASACVEVSQFFCTVRMCSCSTKIGYVVIARGVWRKLSLFEYANAVHSSRALFISAYTGPMGAVFDLGYRGL
jgi:hypothetical protein